MRSALELERLDPEFALAAAAEAVTATTCSRTQRTGAAATGSGIASTTAAAVALEDDDNVARMRTLSEQERQIVSRVLGSDKTSVWKVCQSLRDACDARQFEPNFDFPTSGALGFSPGNERQTPPLTGRTGHQRLRYSKQLMPPAGDRKSRMSVARTQEAAPCCRSVEPRANKHRAIKMAEKVIARYRSESAANGQVAARSSRQPGAPAGFSGTADHKNKGAARQPSEAVAEVAARQGPATPAAPHGRRPKQQQPQSPLRAAFSKTSTSTTSSASTAPMETFRSGANSPSARLQQRQPLSTSVKASSLDAAQSVLQPQGWCRQPQETQQRAAPSSIRSRIRFLPLAAALARSGFVANGDISQDDEDWDTIEVDIRRLTRRRRLDALMNSQLAEHGIGTGAETGP